MGNVLAIIIYLLCFLMFFVKREQKLVILLVYIICFRDVFVNHSLIVNPVAFFIFSEIKHIRQYIQTPRKYNLQIYVMAIFIGCVLLIWNSPHLRSITELLEFIRSELLYKYMLLFVPLVVMKGRGTMQDIVRPVFISLLILTLFGLHNLLFQHAIFVDWAFEGQDLNSMMADAGDKFSGQERFRVQAMHFNPFDYGFISLALMMFFYYLRKERIVKPSLFVIAMFCCIFGIISCGCRTLIVCTALGLFCIYVMTHSLKKTMWMMALLFILLYLAYLYVPAVNEKVETMVLSVFDTKMRSDVSGSSIAMRTYQLMAVLARISGHSLLGMGYKYFNIDLGWSDGSEGLIDEDLYGLEGIYLNLLLERGFVGLFVYLFFMFILMRVFFIYRKTNINASAFLLSLSFVYMAFAFMTGELNVAFITFLLLGIGMKIHSFKSIEAEKP